MSTTFAIKFARKGMQEEEGRKFFLKLVLCKRGNGTLSHCTDVEETKVVQKICDVVNSIHFFGRGKKDFTEV